MRTTKSFINAVNADIANANAHYSNMWKVAEMQEFAGNKPHKVYAAIVYVCERIDSEPEFWIYYNFDSTMGNTVRYTTRKTAKEAEEEFTSTLV